MRLRHLAQGRDRLRRRLAYPCRCRSSTKRRTLNRNVALGPAKVRKRFVVRAPGQRPAGDDLVDSRYARIPRAATDLAPIVARAAVAAVVVMAAFSCPVIAVAGPQCPDMIVGAEELDEILDQTLGTLRGLVDRRSVLIDPSSSSCYVRFSLTASALSQSGASCRLDGCSSIIFRRQEIALRDFDVTGCEPLFNVFGLSRHVPAAYADASARIRQHCGADNFEIDGVNAMRIASVPKLQIHFRPAPAPD